jgi:type II secretory pathway pseudopilin PulG
MSTGLIVAIVIVALIILALLFLLPRMRAAARHKQAERELRSRREQVAGEHREVASERETRAEEAERKARMAQQAAERERAEANMQRERASMHERGMADDQLIDEHEREKFADVAGPDRSADADRDSRTTDDRPRAATEPDRTAATPPSGGATTGRDSTADRQGSGIRSGTTGDTGEPAATSPDYQRGREDERRFERSRLTEDVRESDRSRTS